MNSSPDTTPPATIKKGYAMGREHLAAAGSAEPAVEAEVLLRFVLGVDRARLYAHWHEAMAPDAWARYRSLLEERRAGRPLHYIVGEREFMGLSFAVDERVMIPRPETESLVEVALAYFGWEGSVQPVSASYDRLHQVRRGLAGSPGRPDRATGITSTRAGFRPGPPAAESGPEPVAADDMRAPIVVDVGTGSGCVAVSLAHFLSCVRVYAIDLSGGALEVAHANAVRHGVAARITLLHGDLLGPLPSCLRGRVVAVLSNPPYVPEAALPDLPREIREFEPRQAILAPGDGMEGHRRLAAEALEWLAPGGLLAMEVGRGQADAVRGMLETSGRYAAVGVEHDGSGIGRVVWGVAEK